MPMISVFDTYQHAGPDMTEAIYNEVLQHSSDYYGFQTYINGLVVADMNRPSWTPKRTRSRSKIGKRGAKKISVSFNGTQEVKDWMKRMDFKHIESLIMEDKGYVYDGEDHLQWQKPQY